MVENDLSILRELMPSDRGLLSKPFFASQFTDYVDSIPPSGVRKPILDYLIDAYIRRESAKIVDRDGRALLSPAGHRRFFEEIADNMWTGATRFVTAGELRLIAELVCSELNLSSDAAEQFRYKVTSYAGFSVFQADRFAFEHDVYCDYFLSIVLARSLSEGLANFLNRAVLPREVSEQVALRTNNRDAATKFLFSIPLENISAENSRKNIGLLTSDLLRLSGVLKDLAVSGVHFIEVTLSGLKIQNTSFTRCEFKRTDLGDTVLEDCKFDECLGQGLIVNEHTRFQYTKFLPENGLQSILVRSLGREFFAPKEIVDNLIKIGAVSKDDITGEPEVTEAQLKVVRLLSDLQRCYRRANPVCIDEDPGANRVNSNANWPQVETALIDSGVVSVEGKATSGAPKRFLRLRYSLAEVMAAAGRLESAKAVPKAFWGSVSRLRLRD